MVLGFSGIAATQECHLWPWTVEESRLCTGALLKTRRHGVARSGALTRCKGPCRHSVEALSTLLLSEQNTLFTSSQ